MLPSETMIWQPEFTDKTLSRKPGAVQHWVNYRKQAGAHMSAHGLRGCSMNPLNGPVPGNVICYN
nr:hypothetical protein [Escherichia coli]